MWRRQEAQVFWFSLKTVVTVCQWLGLKTTAMVSCFGPQNQGRQFGDFGPQNRRDSFLVWASKPTKRRFVSLCLKTDERMKTV
jgi:hypothetical protein